MPANFSTISDAELIQQSRNGDESAYGEIVQRHQSLVCSVAYNRCGDLATSEDLAQDAFIQAWKKLADLSDVTKFKSWICTIVRNMASQSHAKATRNVATGASQLDSVVEPASAADNPVARVISEEQQQVVWQALAAIPENYREPMILFYREEQSVARVAEALEISQDAVKQRLSAYGLLNSIERIEIYVNFLGVARGLPVDVRHNAKINRPKLGAWLRSLR